MQDMKYIFQSTMAHVTQAKTKSNEPQLIITWQAQQGSWLSHNCESVKLFISQNCPLSYNFLLNLKK